MAGIESFDDVHALEERELKTLLDEGHPEQRVWAIWALALRSTLDASALASRREPDAGVRRNLAVVLAGHGHYDLLVALANRDPAPEVRAAAMQLVVRLAIDGALASVHVTERALKDSAEVRVAVLGCIAEHSPTWVVDLAERMLGDREGEVRYEAFEALLRAGRMPPALMWLEEASEADARLALVRWSGRGDLRGCAEALAGSSRRLRNLFVDSVRAATWHDLAPVIGHDPVLIRALAGRNRSAFEQVPLAVLVRAAIKDSSDTWIMLIRDRLAALDAPDEVAHVLPEYRDVCSRRIADLDTQVAKLRGQNDDAADSEANMLEDLRLAFEHALDHTSRLLVH
ncbi:MAG: hypothetical protein JWO36_697 [Myxococcales bacterium]|nr:hypothetical protein [Myxococcales bacterium]